MTIINRKQFEEHFLDQLEGDILTWKSPHLSYMTRQHGFECDKNPDGQYDTVIIDCEEKYPIHPDCLKSTYRSPEMFCRDILGKYLKVGGRLMGKFPINFILKLQDKRYSDFNIRSLDIQENYVFVDIVNETSDSPTKVTWSNQKVTQEINIHDDIVLHTYNEEIYDFINTIDLSESYRRVTIDGKGYKTRIQLEKRGGDIDTNCVLFVRNTGNNPKVETYEDICDTNVGGDFFIFPNKTVTEQFMRVFKIPFILDTIKNLSYNKYDSMKLAHKSYIFNPQTLSLL